jgi:hypothetical protein
VIEQEPLVPHQWDIETDVVVARFGAAGFSSTQRLIPFGPSPRTNQAKEENRMKNMWRADPLVWGHGPRVFEGFLEPTCPFSVKAFGKLDDLLGQAGEDQITIKLRLQSQPCTYSGMIVRCILAASTLESGKAAAKPVMAAVAAHRKQFEFDHHCGGANLDATPNDVIGRIERYSGVKLADAFFDREVKWHCKYARQNGIHVSPTFMIDSLIQTDMSSGDPITDWVSHLLEQVIASTEGGRLSRAAGVRIVRSAGLRGNATRHWHPRRNCGYASQYTPVFADNSRIWASGV